MRTRMVWWFASAASLLPLAGCQQSQSATVKIIPVPPPQPFVFYDEMGGPSERTPALSEMELREIVDWVATQTADRIWLIRVRPSIGQTRNDMVAYLVPDEATPRIRVGRAYDIPKTREKTGIRSPWRYAQVSVPGHSFGAQLIKPSVREMPFRQSMIVDPASKERSDLAQREVVAVLDFVRRRSSGIPIIGALLGHTIGPKGPNLPVLSIGNEGDAIEVTFGYMHGRLWGHGIIVEIKRTRDRYKVVGWGKWIS